MELALAIGIPIVLLAFVIASMVFLNIDINRFYKNQNRGRLMSSYQIRIFRNGAPHRRWRWELRGLNKPYPLSWGAAKTHKKAERQAKRAQRKYDKYETWVEKGK